MSKKLLLALALVVFIAIFIEIIALIKLKADVQNYANYWKHYQSSGDFTYVILGDSAAQGIGTSKPQKSYGPLLAQRIEQHTGKKVRIVNLSVSGANVADVIQKQVPRLQNYRANLITLEVGGNNITRDYNSRMFQSEFDTLASRLPKNTVVANIPYFGGIVRKNHLALDANIHIAKSVAKHNLRLVDLQTITKERQSILNYSADFFHPNDRGYKNWVDGFWEAIKPIL